MKTSFNGLIFNFTELNGLNPITHSANSLNKKIIMVATLIFSLLGLCYAFGISYFKKKGLVDKRQSDSQAVKSIDKLSGVNNRNEQLKAEALQKNFNALQMNFDAMKADLNAKEKAKLCTEDELAQKKQAIQKLQDQIASMEMDKLKFKQTEEQLQQLQKDLNQKDQEISDAEQKKKSEIFDLLKKKDKELSDAEQKKKSEIADLEKNLREAKVKLMMLEDLEKLTIPTVKDAKELREDYVGKESQAISLDEKLKKAKNAGIFLTSLNLQKTLITTQQLEEVLSACPNLQELNLSECQHLKENVIQNLPSGLRTLNISHCKWVTDWVIKELPKNLRSLKLSHCSKLTSAAIKELPKGLEELHLQFFYNLDAVNIQQFPPNLKTLNLSSSNLNDHLIEYLPKTIQSLSLNYLMYLKGRNFDRLPPNLHTLDLSNCLEITESSLTNLPRTLLNLNLSGCWKLTNGDLQNLPPNIQWLDLSFCATSTDLDEFMKCDAPKDLKTIILSKNYQDANPKTIPNLSKKFQVIIK